MKISTDSVDKVEGDENELIIWLKDKFYHYYRAVYNLCEVRRCYIYLLSILI